MRAFPNDVRTLTRSCGASVITCRPKRGMALVVVKAGICWRYVLVTIFQMQQQPDRTRSQQNLAQALYGRSAQRR